MDEPSIRRTRPTDDRSVMAQSLPNTPASKTEVMLAASRDIVADALNQFIEKLEPDAFGRNRSKG